DANGNLYVGDRLNHRIRKITPAGEVTTLAGSGTAGFTNATGTSAAFNQPIGMAVDASGNVYVADYSNNRIRKITSAGVVTTLAGSGTTGYADGTGTAAAISGPHGVCVDASGNVYVACYNDHRIRKITAAGVVTTIAGSGIAGFANGTGTAATFNNPTSIAVDGLGNLYVADPNNNRIRKITPTGVVTTFAGSGTAGSANGTGTAATFNSPYFVVADGAGNVVVSEIGNIKIRQITPAGVVTTIAGTGTRGFTNGLGTVATFYDPSGVAVDPSGNIYVADYNNHSIRKLTPCTTPATPTITGSNSFCAGTTTILTASASSAYLWSTGETTQSIAVGIPGDYSVVAISGACTSATSGIVSVTELQTGTWLGNTAIWGNPANWCGGVPTGNTDVTLTNRGLSPVVYLNPATCRNLTIPEGLTLNIDAGSVLYLSGNLYGLGNVAGPSSSGINLGSNNQTITIQRVNVGSISVYGNVNLAGNITISNSVLLYNGVLNTQANTLFLTNTAESPIETANSYIVGNVRSNARMIGTGSGSMFGITIAAGTDNLDTVMIERGENPATYNGNQGIGHIWKIRAGNQPVS
ncbi:MAG: hypothetical protein ACOVMN_01215, partial [Flexibacteraceae bacterium]